MSQKSTLIAVLVAVAAVAGLAAVAVADNGADKQDVRITVDGDVAVGNNVTITGEINGSAAPGLNVTVNGEEVGTTNETGQVVAEVPNASEMEIEMENETASGSRTISLDDNSEEDGADDGENETEDGDDETEVGENETEDGDDETEDDEEDDGSTGPAGEVPEDLATFANTSQPGAVTPNSLSGKIRAESAVAGDVEIELLRSSATNYTLAITAPNGTENVTFYLQSQAVESSQDIDNLTMYLDGERWEFYEETAENSSWIVFEVDHFSTQEVTFTSETDSDDGPAKDDVNITVNGTVEAGNNVTVTGEINGSAAPGLNVTVNGEEVGTTNATGQIVAEVPNASEMEIEMENETASGSKTIDLEEDEEDEEDDESDEEDESEKEDDEAEDGDDESEEPEDGDDEADEGDEGDDEGGEGDGEGDGPGGPAAEAPGDLAAFTNTSQPGAVTPNSLSGKIRAESAVAGDVEIELLRDSATNYSLAITAPNGTENVTFYLQSQAVESSQDIDNVTMYLDDERQDFYVDESAGPGNSPWIAFEVDHFSTRTVTFTSEEVDDGGATNPAAEYADPETGQVDTQGLLNAAADFRNGELDTSTLLDVAAAFRSGNPVT